MDIFKRLQWFVSTIQQENKPNNQKDTEIEMKKEDLQFLNKMEKIYGKGDPDLPGDAKSDNTEKSILGHHSIELSVRVEMSKYEETKTLRQSEEADELLLDVATFYTTVSFASTNHST